MDILSYPDIIDYVIQQHYNTVPKYHLLKLKPILLKYLKIIPSWEFDIGKYRGEGGTLTNYDKLTLTPIIDVPHKFINNYPHMLKPDVAKEIDRLVTKI